MKASHGHSFHQWINDERENKTPTQDINDNNDVARRQKRGRRGKRKKNEFVLFHILHPFVSECCNELHFVKITFSYSFRHQLWNSLSPIGYIHEIISCTRCIHSRINYDEYFDKKFLFTISVVGPKCLNSRKKFVDCGYKRTGRTGIASKTSRTKMSEWTISHNYT